jgi:hypothetical protein
MAYKLVPVETYTGDPALRQLLIAVGRGELDSGTAQAAAWHITDKMSWDKLSEKKIEHVGGVDDEPYFSEAQIAAARQLVAKLSSEKPVENGEQATRSN